MRNKYNLLSKRTIHENESFSLEHSDLITPSGRPGTFEVIRPKKQSVAIVSLDDNMYSWIINRYRFATDSYEWELPKFTCSLDGENTTELAQKELNERTGITALYWRMLLYSNPSNLFSDEVSISFLARQLSFGQPNTEYNEQVEVQRLHLDELVEMVFSRQINCLLSQNTIMAAKILKDKNQI